MKLSNYEIVMKSICKNLVDVEERLSRDRIENEVNGVKILMDNSPLHILQSSFFRNLTNKLEAKDWELMKRDLETKFNVEMDAGTLIQGDEQQNRNTTWWIDKGRFESENFYWNRYREYMRETLPFDVVKAIDEDTNAVMNNLADPELDEFSRYGMVVGHVQSGKTSNYAGLICKAADAGYKFIVVIAGSTNTLRNQTQDRINKSFIGKDETGTYIGAGKYGDKKPSYDPHILTTKNKDFNIKDAINNSQGLNFDNVTSPIVLIIKKHSSTLSNVISWLSNVYKDGKISTHSMLLIDDESDYASINTKKPENPTAINDKIRKLLNKFKKSAYVAYTATPYANIFIDHKATDDIRGKDLFPKDFIYALEVPSNYFGARKIFIDSDYEHIITIEEPENLRLKHKKDDDISYLPKTLEEAIRLFLINIGIRNLRNQGSKHNSMLIHASRFTMIHQKIGICVGSYFSGLRNDIVSYGLLNNAEIQSNNIRDMKETFKLRCKDCEFTWEDVIKSISYKVESVIIREVHSETDKKNNLIYDDDRPTNAIVIGGTSLARGYTLEGLSISYFLRSTVFYDTLMQMGRWFGYRGGYDDLCKIYMTEDMRDNFKFIIEATEDLFEDFKDMELDKKTPEDFGLAVRQHPDSILQVTARNKQQSSIDIDHEIKLDGSLKETSKLSPDNISIKNNIKLIENTISKV
ncbi:Z1 domain-containing protein, partial [Paraclostridium bifermentans]|uniref:Z1 domain-containing protein n=1 Tax=Paraclostridium bifermentans TaxID=1490 RepID=UPI00374E64C9